MIVNAKSSPPEAPPDSAFPSGDNVTFHESSYFVNHTAFPSFEDVRAESAATGRGVARRPKPAHFPDRNLIVKWGFYVSPIEGQCLWMVRRLVRDKVPVPEIYGWAKDGDDVFLFMERVEGVTLESCWDRLTVKDRQEVCAQLQFMMDSLRSMTPNKGRSYIGSVAGQPLLDILFKYGEACNSITSMKDFHDWYCRVGCAPFEETLPSSLSPVRQGLPDDAEITFTHNDLHPSNIIVSASSQDPVCVVALVDWHQSGWYPSYWEYCKALMTVEKDGDWAMTYVPSFLPKPTKECYDTWTYCMQCLQ